MAFLGINIAMGIVNLPAVRDYWSSGISHVPWFRSIMPGYRFEQICSFLHLSDNSKTPEKTSSTYKLYKLGNVHVKVNENAKKAYVPSQQLSIDEQMIGTKCRISFIQYMPEKPKKFGVKLWVLAEALSGYCLHFQVYTGKVDDKPEHGLTYRVVMDLMYPYLNKNHMLYFDNFYSSPKLVKDLMQKETYSCGTIRVDRGYFRDDFKKAKLEVGDSLFIREGNVIATHWKDKRDVYVISSIHGNECIELQKRNETTISKPKMILEYNTYMGGVDKCDQYLSYYSIGRKTIKWWKRVFFRVFEICVVNSIVVYFSKNPNFQKKKNSHKLFREAYELVQPLLDRRADGDVNLSSGRLSVSDDKRLKGKHFAESRHPKRGRCVKCSSDKNVRGFPKDTKTSNFCQKCDAFICKTCFKVFHTSSRV